MNLTISRTLRSLCLLIAVVLLGTAASVDGVAQGPQRKEFGFGLVFGDPLGGTVKYWLNRENALAANIGASYFGSPRIGVDYLWHFDAFGASWIMVYAGPGAVLGIGEGKGLLHKEKEGRFYVRQSGETGIGVRGILGLNVIPGSAPVELYLELGPLLGLTPEVGSAFDAAVGVRFYP